MTATFLFHCIRVYMESGVLLFIACLLCAGLSALLGWRRSIPQRFWLQLSHLVVLSALFFPVLMEAIPSERLFAPTVQVWSGTNRMTQQSYALLAPTNPTLSGSHSIDGFKMQNQALFLFILGVLTGLTVYLAKLMSSIRRLRKLIAGGHLIRKVGGVSILASGRISIPLAAWFGRAYVVVPIESVIDFQQLRISVAHELQHHRQRDTLWAYLYEFLKSLYFWNPAIYLWSKRVEQLQEFACDEYLIGHRRVSAQAYSSCLVETAKRAMNPPPVFVGATKTTRGLTGSTLKRRIKMIIRYESRPSSKWLPALVVLMVGLIASCAFAFKSAVQDKTISLHEAQALAKKAAQRSEIPVSVNEMVLDQLNRYLGTPEGRAYLKQTFANMPKYKDMIEKKLRRGKLPLELMAVPAHESKYANITSSLGTGIWMFIAPTARHYGLLVDDKVDERRDEEKETDAAVKYFTDLYGMFHDWRLALKAYNVGEKKVWSLIDQLGTRDPWAIEKAFPTNERYLSSVTALIIIMKNPSVLE